MSLMMMRAALIARNALPPQYQRVEYVASTGTEQYVDTGIRNVSTLDDDIEIVVKDNGSTLTTIKAFMGTRSSNGGIIGWFRAGYKYGIYVHTDYISDILIENKIKIRINNNTINIGDNYTVTTTSYVGPNKFYLFTCTDSNGAPEVRRANCKIYSFSIKGKCNYIPCRRKSDNIAGFWDTVSKTFKSSVKSNYPLVAGPDVL